MSPRVWVIGAALLLAATAGAGTQPGCVERVVRDGTVVFDRADGVRRVGGHEPLTASTRFRLASLSKQFTAAAILRLVESGRLSLDDRVGDLLPELPAYAHAVTLRHLLTHTGGLPDYEDLMETAPGPRYTARHQIDDEGVLRLLGATAKPRFAAGTRWAYSNSGYVVLGLVVARASGQTLGQYLQGAVFAPAGMSQTSLHVPGKDRLWQRAYGHARVGAAGAIVVSDQSPTSATGGDGGIYSTVDDLTRWLAALSRGTAVPASWAAEAFSPARLADGGATVWPAEPDEDNLDPGGPVAYGFGWFLDPAMGQARRWHFGTTEGFRTAIDWFPDARVGTVVLCNRMDVDARQRALANARPYLLP